MNSSYYHQRFTAAYVSHINKLSGFNTFHSPYPLFNQLPIATFEKAFPKQHLHCRDRLLTDSRKEMLRRFSLPSANPIPAALTDPEKEYEASEASREERSDARKPTSAPDHNNDTYQEDFQ